jgi:uncharacterized C2H2 Zn-finger protein
MSYTRREQAVTCPRCGQTRIRSLDYAKKIARGTRRGYCFDCSYPRVQKRAAA